MWEENQATSSGLKWTISPPLDANVFELVTTSGSDEGSIRMREGVKVPLMDQKTYTVTCTADISGKEIDRTADVDIVVVSRDID